MQKHRKLCVPSSSPLKKKRKVKKSLPSPFRFLPHNDHHAHHENARKRKSVGVTGLPFFTARIQFHWVFPQVIIFFQLDKNEHKTFHYTFLYVGLYVS